MISRIERLALIMVLSLSAFVAQAEDRRISEIRTRMDSLVVQCPAFKESVDISVGRMRLSELLRMVAEMKKVNLSVRDDFDCVVSCSFSKSRVDDLIVFLCREYSLDIEIFGNIVSIFKYESQPEPYIYPVIGYTTDSLISFNFKDKRLEDVTRGITEKTGENIIIPKHLKGLITSGYASRVPVSDALAIIAGENDLELFFVNGENRLWCLGDPVIEKKEKSIRNSGRYNSDNLSDTTILVPLKSRSVIGVKEIIPEQICEGLNVIISEEMNSLILHGEQVKAGLLREYLSRIDVKIPLVSIDVMIVETTRKFARQVGLKAGKRDSPSETEFHVGEGMEISVGSAHMNSILGKIEGFSNVNLGNVADNLYAELKLLEDRGFVNLESTPKLATLNGHKAVLTKGETKYYKEINTSYMGSQNPLQTSSYNWKSVDADLILTITPFVSCDSLVTLDIDLSQSEFGSMAEETAPPEIKKRGFKSIVRITDGDVVLLGGLDSDLTYDSRKGIPGFTKIPFLRWIFGGQDKERTDTKMNVFIRATLID